MQSVKKKSVDFSYFSKVGPGPLLRLVAQFATRARCCLMFHLVSTRMPSCFPAGWPPACSVPGFILFQFLQLSLLNFMRLLLSPFLQLFEVPLDGSRLPGISATPPSLVSLANVLRVPSASIIQVTNDDIRQGSIQNWPLGHKIRYWPPAVCHWPPSGPGCSAGFNPPDCISVLHKSSLWLCQEIA